MKFARIFSLNDEQFLNELYALLLNRAPDDEGKKKYIRALNRGESRTSVIADIAQSKEAISNNYTPTLSPLDAELLKRFTDIHNSYKSFSFRSIYKKRTDERIDSLERLVGNLAASITSTAHPKLNDTANIIYCVKITGGIGDAVIIARFIRDFQVYIDANARYDIYFHSPDSIRLFFENLPGFRAILSDSQFQDNARQYTFALYANQFLTFLNEHIQTGEIIREAPRVMECFHHVQEIRQTIDKYITNHPNFDGAFADLAVKSGHKRYTFLHYMAGIKYTGHALNISLDRELSQKLIGRPYLTVHDGWDTKFRFNIPIDRPTKALPKITWDKIIHDLKQQVPNIAVVQIGSSAGSDITMVDYQFRGRLNLRESLSILAGAMLHVDTESGLVHIASSIGVKSAVLFGPTNMLWFGYDENINIPPRACGNCWWSTSTWMEKCPVGHKDPICMHSHDSTFTSDLIKRMLKKSVV